MTISLDKLKKIPSLIVRTKKGTIPRASKRNIMILSQITVFHFLDKDYFVPSSPYGYTATWAVVARTSLEEGVYDITLRRFNIFNGEEIPAGYSILEDENNDSDSDI